MVGAKERGETESDGGIYTLACCLIFRRVGGGGEREGAREGGGEVGLQERQASGADP